MVLGWTGLVSLVQDAVGRGLLGEAWGIAQPVLVPVAAQMAGSALVMGAVIVLRGAAEPRRSLRSRVTQSILVIAGASVGAVAWGVRGAAWMMAGATAISAVIWWRAAVKGVRDRVGTPPVRVGENYVTDVTHL